MTTWRENAVEFYSNETLQQNDIRRIIIILYGTSLSDYDTIDEKIILLKTLCKI